MSDTAEAKGYKRGREYLQMCKIEDVTFEEYRNLGKVAVKQQYRQKKAQDAYLLGWWHAGEQMMTLFKQNGEDRYQTQKSVDRVRQQLHSLCSKVEAILEAQDSDPILQDMLQDAYESLDSAQMILNTINAHLRSNVT